MLRFVKLQEHHLEQVLDWRTKPEVTRYMYTDVAYDLERQRDWYARVSQDGTARYWVTEFNGEPFGLVNLTGLDRAHRRCYWGYYIGEDKHRLIGGMLAPYVYNYALGELGLHKVMGEVMAGNENVRKMHRLQGCREVGVLRDHIYKYDTFHDVYVYEMTASDWAEQEARYRHCIASFE